MKIRELPPELVMELASHIPNMVKEDGSIPDYYELYDKDGNPVRIQLRVGRGLERADGFKMWREADWLSMGQIIMERGELCIHTLDDEEYDVRKGFDLITHFDKETVDALGEEEFWNVLRMQGWKDVVIDVANNFEPEDDEDYDEDED